MTPFDRQTVSHEGNLCTSLCVSFKTVKIQSVVEISETALKISCLSLKPGNNQKV